jgi:hypothetical protein
MRRIATVLLVVALGAGCDIDLAQGFGDLLSIRDGVVKIVDARNVKVNINNGSTLTIYIINSSLNSRPSHNRKLVADKVSQMAYERYTNRKNLEIVYVVFSAYEKKFAVVEITSTVETFQYSPKELGGLTVSTDTATPRRPNNALQLTDNPLRGLSAAELNR